MKPLKYFVQRHYGSLYRINLRHEEPVSGPIEREYLSCESDAWSFIRELKFLHSDCLFFLRAVDELTPNSDISLYYSQRDLARVSWGRYRRISFYPFDDSVCEHYGPDNPYPAIKTPQGVTYHFVSASVLLVSNPDPADVRFFKFDEWPQAREFLDTLNLTDEQLAMIIPGLELRAWPNRKDWLESLLTVLTRGKIVVTLTHDDITPSKRKGPEDLPVEYYTPKPYTLGPHEEPGYEPNPHAGLHNQEELTPDPKTSMESFKPARQVNMDNLSVEDKATENALEKQGWDDYKVKQILKSGNNFTETPYQVGDKIYGFNTADRARKLDTSAYLLDETGMVDVKGKYFKQGHWDKEGVKDYLALPCFNGASQIDMMEVTQPTIGIQSTIGKATELLRYDGADGYTTGTIGKIMGGGGSQITLDTSALKLLPGK